jgi:hypothetical protein
MKNKSKAGARTPEQRAAALIAKLDHVRKRIEKLFDAEDRLRSRFELLMPGIDGINALWSDERVEKRLDMVLKVERFDGENLYCWLADYIGNKIDDDCGDDDEARHSGFDQAVATLEIAWGARREETEEEAKAQRRQLRLWKPEGDAQ